MKDIIETNITTIEEWENLQKEYFIKGFHRPRLMPQDSLKRASELFNSISGNTIVECGSGIHGDLSGNSSIVWLNNTGAQEIHCIDLNNSVLDTLPNSDRIIKHNMDCFQVVKDFNGTIDMLYLDFCHKQRAQAYYDLYMVSKKPSLILIDDTDHADPWKQTLIVPHAIRDGYKVLWIGRQTMLCREV